MTRERKPVVVHADIRMRRTIAEAQALMVPEVTDCLTAEQLSRHVAAQLATLPATERRRLRRNAQVAMHDLEELVAVLESELSDLADELRTVSSHSGAVTAYGRTGRRPSENRS